jgi:hypothetical protein
MIRKMEQLKKESFQILEDQQTQEFLELQNKFDNLYKSLKNELLSIQILIKEMKNNREKFIKKEKFDFNEIVSIDKNLELLSKERIKINNYQYNLIKQDYDFNF